MVLLYMLWAIRIWIDQKCSIFGILLVRFVRLARIVPLNSCRVLVGIFLVKCLHLKLAEVLQCSFFFSEEVRFESFIKVISRLWYELLYRLGILSCSALALFVRIWCYTRHNVRRKTVWNHSEQRAGNRFMSTCTLMSLASHLASALKTSVY